MEILLYKLDMKNTFGVTVGDFFPFRIGDGRRLDEGRGWCGWLIRKINRPHDVVRADLVDAVLESEGILDAAGGDGEILQKIFAGFELVWTPCGAPSGPAHVIETPEPEWYPLPHVSEDDLQVGEMIQGAAEHQACSMGTDLHAVTPHGGFHIVVPEWRRHTI